MCTHNGEKPFKCHRCDMTFLMEDNLKSHMYEIHLEDEVNPSMQSYINIQSSTMINPEQHSFQYGIFDQNIAHHSKSSTRCNSLDEATVTWSPTETIEIRLILFPVFELTVASRQRMTVKKEYGSQGRPDVYTW